MAELTKCPKCNSVNLDLAERNIIIYSWTQTDNGISGDFEEDLEETNIDNEVTATCMRCKHHWTIPGTVDDLPGFSKEA